MSWKLRHQGSPQWVEVPELEQVLEGMRDGLWEPTDEVMGPDQSAWMPIEQHPQLAEAALDYEPIPRHRHEEPTSLDMTALIDVTLVLLIFFVICKTYSEFKARLDTPDFQTGRVGDAMPPPPDGIDKISIHVTVRNENGKPVIRVEKKEVDPDNLTAELDRYVRGSRRSAVLLEADDEVAFRYTAAVQDAARGARIEKVYWVQQPK
jgi:biopolymer transport protein ExbD